MNAQLGRAVFTRDLGGMAVGREGFLHLPRFGAYLQPSAQRSVGEAIHQ
jgi:hypothetical protein